MIDRIISWLVSSAVVAGFALADFVEWVRRLKGKR